MSACSILCCRVVTVAAVHGGIGVHLLAEPTQHAFPKRICTQDILSGAIAACTAAAERRLVDLQVLYGKLGDSINLD